MQEGTLSEACYALWLEDQCPLSDEVATTTVGAVATDQLVCHSRYACSQGPLAPETEELE